MPEKEMSEKEKRIRNLTQLYYSRPEIQQIIYDFSKNREISPRYFEGFGKRPDSLQYPSDIFQMTKKGATSFHCSEELWRDPLRISTDLNEKQLNELRIGWDLLIDIDCKWFDYSKLAAKSIIQVFKDHGVNNIGIKFSGSKGWHLLVPWKAFPKEINGTKAEELFPELPRKIVSYIRFEAEKNLKTRLPDNFYSQFKNVDIKKGVKCQTCNEIAETYELIELYCQFCGRGETKKIIKGTNNKKYSCPECRRELKPKEIGEIHECNHCSINSQKKPNNFSRAIEVDLFELMGLDIVLVSPRHLFRMPYSLHEKTALASIVIDESEIENFQPKDANPMKARIRDFVPDSKEEEASELVMQSLDWAKDNQIRTGEKNEKISGKYAEFKPIQLKNFQDEQLPPSIQKILQGIGDGKKRAVFILLNFFRSIGMEKEELEKRLYEWNEKNEVPLNKGYITSQLLWAYRHKPVMPPNFDKDYYKGIGVVPTPEEMKSKNPVTFTIRKNFSINRVKSKDNSSNKSNKFKNNK